MTELPLHDVERALAVSYAPVARRAGLHALFALDERLGGIVATARDPTIGLMRLLWWRDALAALDDAPPPAEPLLRALAADTLPWGVTGASLAGLEEGWAALLDGDEAALARHARARGGDLFKVAATMLGAADTRLPLLGEAWALVENQIRWIL